MRGRLVVLLRRPAWVVTIAVGSVTAAAIALPRADVPLIGLLVLVPYCPCSARWPRARPGRCPFSSARGLLKVQEQAAA